MDFKNEYELQLDLAEYLRSVGYLTYTEIEIKSGRGGRADVVAVKPSYPAVFLCLGGASHSLSLLLLPP